MCQSICYHQCYQAVQGTVSEPKKTWQNDCFVLNDIENKSQQASKQIKQYLRFLSFLLTVIIICLGTTLFLCTTSLLTPIVPGSYCAKIPLASQFYGTSTILHSYYITKNPKVRSNKLLWFLPYSICFKATYLHLCIHFFFPVNVFTWPTH